MRADEELSKRRQQKGFHEFLVFMLSIFFDLFRTSVALAEIVWHGESTCPASAKQQATHEGFKCHIRIRTNLLKRERETQKFSNRIILKLSKMMFLRNFKLVDTVIHSCASKGESSSQHPVIPSFKSITMRPAIHCHSWKLVTNGMAFKPALWCWKSTLTMKHSKHEKHFEIDPRSKQYLFDLTNNTAPQQSTPNLSWQTILVSVNHLSRKPFLGVESPPWCCTSPNKRERPIAHLSHLVFIIFNIMCKEFQDLGGILKLEIWKSKTEICRIRCKSELLCGCWNDTRRDPLSCGTRTRFAYRP